MSQTLIHIGYHKTGTSFLQKKIFEVFDDFNRVNQYSINRAFIYPGPFHFNTNKAKSFINNNIKPDKINIFSNERLSGDPHSGGKDAKDIAVRILQTAPDAKIVMIVREQASAIFSSYSQYIKAIGSAESHLKCPFFLG